MAAAQPTGELDLGLGDAHLPPGMTASLLVEGSTEALTLAAPFVGAVPVGQYKVKLGAGPVAGPFDVRPGQRTSITVERPALGELHARCDDAGPVPCKLTVEGTGKTPTPDFGPGAVAGPAHSQVTTADGAVDLRLLARTYRVTASRGPRVHDRDGRRGPHEGPVAGGELELHRVVETGGYLGCDFHQHTMLGTDASTSLADRVVSNVAEGVEIAVASEHNVVADLGPAIQALKLDRWLVSIPGDELTTDASTHPWGHANVWPLAFDPAKPRGGAPAVRDRTALELFAALRREAPRGTSSSR